MKVTLASRGLRPLTTDRSLGLGRRCGMAGAGWRKPGLKGVKGFEMQAGHGSQQSVIPFDML